MTRSWSRPAPRTSCGTPARAARAALLLLAGVLPRGHRPARERRPRAVLVALLAALATAVRRRPPRRHRRAAPGDVLRPRLHGARRAPRALRRAVGRAARPWEPAELDSYLLEARAAARARAARLRPLARPAHAHAAVGERGEREFAEFRARYPWVTNYVTWNEANHCSQPTCRRPDRVGAVLRRAQARVPALPDRRPPTCSTTRGSPTWASAFLDVAGRDRRLIWGLHNYIDANRFRTRGTRALLNATKGEVWFTETGGIVKRKQRRRRLPLPASTRARRAGHALGLPARRALAARQARLLLPLDPGPDRARPGTPRSWTRLRTPAPPTASCTHGCAATASRAPRPPRSRRRSCSPVAAETSEGGISGGGKVIGRTVTVYSLTSDPGGANRDFVDGEKLALSDAGGRAGALAVNFSSLDLGARRAAPGPGRPARDQRPADHRRGRRRRHRDRAAVQRRGDPAGRARRRRAPGERSARAAVGQPTVAIAWPGAAPPDFERRFQRGVRSRARRGRGGRLPRDGRAS